MDALGHVLSGCTGGSLNKAEVKAIRAVKQHLDRVSFIDPECAGSAQHLTLRHAYDIIPQVQGGIYA